MGAGTAEGADPPIGRGVFFQGRRKQVSICNVFGKGPVYLRRTPALAGILAEEGEVLTRQ